MALIRIAREKTLAKTKRICSLSRKAHSRQTTDWIRTRRKAARPKGRSVLPHPAENPFPLVAGIIAEKTRTPA